MTFWRKSAFIQGFNVVVAACFLSRMKLSLSLALEMKTCLSIVMPGVVRGLKGRRGQRCTRSSFEGFLL